MDADAISARLTVVRDLLTELTRLHGITRSMAGSCPLTASVQRFLQSIVDHACGINTAIVAADLGRTPSSAAESFRLAAQAGAIGAELADELAALATTQDLSGSEQAAAALVQVQRVFGAYVRQVTAFMKARTPSH